MINVTEKLPPEGQLVLVQTKKGTLTKATWMDFGCYMDWHFENEADEGRVVSWSEIENI